MDNVEMVRKFLCPGCTCGINPEGCGEFNLTNDYGFSCNGHSAGTFISNIGAVRLGLPKGFDKVGLDSIKGNRVRGQVRLWPQGKPDWDYLNIPTWAFEKDGFLFVRTYSPRVNLTYIDIMQGKKMSDINYMTFLDASTFIDEID